jgi:hypothetical protein
VDEQTVSQLTSDPFYLSGALIDDGSSDARTFLAAMDQGPVTHEVTRNPAGEGFVVRLTVEKPAPESPDERQGPTTAETEAPALPPGAGWFPDPFGRHQHRYWDGTRWSEHAADQGVVCTDHVPTQSQPQEEHRDNTISRRPKPLTMNLGDVEEYALQSIIDSDTPITIAQEMRSDLITPDLACQGLQAKKHEHQAEELTQNHDLDRAVQEYRYAIEIAPYEDELLYMSPGGVLSELREHKEALRYLEIASEINPTHQDVARNLRICRMNAGEF